MAQLVEHSLGKGEVTSSNLVIGTIISRIRRESVPGLVMFKAFNLMAGSRYEILL